MGIGAGFGFGDGLHCALRFGPPSRPTSFVYAWSFYLFLGGLIQITCHPRTPFKGSATKRERNKNEKAETA